MQLVSLWALKKEILPKLPQFVIFGQGPGKK
jgi:hypothetical protein